MCLGRNAVKPSSFSFHIENRYASGETKRPRGPRPASSLTLFRPTLDLPSQAVAYYLNYYLYALVDLPTVSACMSECLTAWMASKRESNMIDLALSTLALAIFSRTQQHPPAAREASLRYGRLLRVAQKHITQAAILRCNENGFDEFLLMIALMAWYETAMHRPENLKQDKSLGSLHSWSHHDGAMAILKAWDVRFKGNAPSSVIKHARRGLIRSALLRNLSLPDWLWNGSRFGEDGLDLGFDNIFVRVVNLRRAFKELEKKDDFEGSMVQTLNIEARELDGECRRWAMQIPSEWSFESHNIPSFWPKIDFYHSTVYTCRRDCHASVWIQYFSLLMLINSTLLELLQRSHPLHLQVNDSLYQLQRDEHITNLGVVADSLAATIPFCLGRFVADKTDATDSRPALALRTEEEITPALALPTVWPLSMASSLSGIKQSQQLWSRAQLARLGRVLGDGALECAGTSEWTHE
jgi:hypothetical protein